MNSELLKLGSQALRVAALNNESKDYLLANPVLFNLVKKAADRYIGGANLDETLHKVHAKNLEGFKCSIEFMGENTTPLEEVSSATQEFINICQAIADLKLNSTIALDLSHIGLAISQELCQENLNRLCAKASMHNIEVIISAESLNYTDAILDIYKKTSAQYPGVGIALQAYLYRSKDDFEDLYKLPGRIRLSKGAYETPSGYSMPRGEMLDTVYLDYADRLLSCNHKFSIATGDDKIQQAVLPLIQKHKADKNNYEFENLFGIRNENLYALKDQGQPCKLYFVYGEEWYLYVCNRIAEYPLNIFQALADVVGIQSL